MPAEMEITLNIPQKGHGRLRFFPVRVTSTQKTLIVSKGQNNRKQEAQLQAQPECYVCWLFTNL